MQPDERRHIEELYNIHRKRLHALELQKATMGYDAPPHINMEIDDINQQLSILRERLGPSYFNEDISYQYEQPKHKAEVEILLKGNFSTINQETIYILQRFVAATLNIPDNQVDVFSIRKGSVIVVLEIPAQKVNRLFDIYEDQKEYFSTLGILNISLVRHENKRVTPNSFTLKTDLENYSLVKTLETLQDQGILLTQDIVINVLQLSKLTIEDFQKILTINLKDR